MPAKRIITRSRASAPGLDVEAAQANPKAFLDNILSTANTQQQRAETLMEIQVRFGEIGGQVVEVMSLTQDIIEKERSWEHLNMNQTTMWEKMDYENSIKPAIEQYRRTDIRCQKYMEKIDDNWGPDWRTELDATQSLLPENTPENMLAAIRRLSDNMTASSTGKHLAKAIQHRLANWRCGQRNTTLATTTDFHYVEKNTAIATLISSGAGAEGSSTRKRQRIEDVEEEDVEEEDVGEKDAEGDKSCSCTNRPVILAKLAAAKKRGFANHNKLIQDIEFLTSGAVNKMCWPHLRRCAAMVGLKTQIGGRNTLTTRIDELWKRRFQFGELITEHRDWFAKPVRGDPRIRTWEPCDFSPQNCPP